MNGSPFTSIKALGMALVSSPRRVPSPPARMATGRHHWTTIFVPSKSKRKRISRNPACERTCRSFILSSA